MSSIEGQRYIAFMQELSYVMMENPRFLRLKNGTEDENLALKTDFEKSVSLLAHLNLSHIPKTNDEVEINPFTGILLPSSVKINKIVRSSKNLKPLIFYEAAVRSNNQAIALKFMKKWSKKINKKIKTRVLPLKSFKDIDEALQRICQKDFSFIRNKKAFEKDFLKVEKNAYEKKPGSRDKNPGQRLFRREVVIRVLLSDTPFIPKHAFKLMIGNKNPSNNAKKYLIEKYCPLIETLDLSKFVREKRITGKDIGLYLTQMKNLVSLNLKGCIDLSSHTFDGLHHDHLKEIDISHTCINKEFITPENFPHVRVIQDNKLDCLDFSLVSTMTWEEIRALALSSYYVSCAKHEAILDKMSEDPSLIALDVMRIIRRKITGVENIPLYASHARKLVEECMKKRQPERDRLLDHVFKVFFDDNEPYTFRSFLDTELRELLSLTKIEWKDETVIRRETHSLSENINSEKKLLSIRKALMVLRRFTNKENFVLRVMELLKERMREIDCMFFENDVVDMDYIRQFVDLSDFLVELSHQIKPKGYGDVLLNWRRTDKPPKKAYAGHFSSIKAYTVMAINTKSELRLDYLKEIFADLSKYRNSLLGDIFAGTLELNVMSFDQLFMNPHLTGYNGLLYEKGEYDQDNIDWDILKKKFLLELNDSVNLTLTYDIIDALDWFCHSAQDDEFNTRQYVYEVLAAMAHRDVPRPLSNVVNNPNLDPKLVKHAREKFDRLVNTYGTP